MIAVWQRRSLIAGAIGALLLVLALFFDVTQAMRSYLFAYTFWTGAGIGALGILLLHHTVGGKWGMVIRRFCEAGANTLPVMGVLFVPVLLSMPLLYEWTHAEAAEDPVLAKKAAYLNIPFFVIRSVLYFAIFTTYAWLLSRWSAEMDRTGDTRLPARMRAVSAPGLVVFVLAATFAFVDWIMSLEPHWFSTIYGAMFLVGQVLTAFAFVIALLITLRDQEPFQHRVTPQHIHDLGNLMFAFTVLWAYLSFSQFLIIWAGNLPEEIPWYIRRTQGGWGVIAAVLMFFHFLVPFVVLLQRDVKRRASVLFRVCIYMLVIRLIDVFWVVTPAFYGSGLAIHWTDFAAMLGIGGIWLAAFFWQLRQRSLLPLGDRRLEGAPKEMVAY